MGFAHATLLRLLSDTAFCSAFVAGLQQNSVDSKCKVFYSFARYSMYRITARPLLRGKKIVGQVKAPCIVPFLLSDCLLCVFVYLDTLACVFSIQAKHPFFLTEVL